MNTTGGAATTTAPTGCYKCGRPGHWSRDCPLSAPPNPNPNPNPNSSSATTTNPKPSSSTSFSKPGAATTLSGSDPPPKPKKAPRTRPKVTPELLLSDEGLGYILRYFQRNFKYGGCGHEVSDLRNLLRMYAEWHSQFLPYFPFDQFIHKVEEAGSSKRLKSCIAELKERVANGGDPTKLKQLATENEKGHDDEDGFDAMEPNHHQEDLVFNENVADDMQEDLFSEIFNKTVEETNPTMAGNNAGAEVPSSGGSDEVPESGAGGSSIVIEITDEIKARMEAKRLQALERAAARSRLLPPS